MEKEGKKERKASEGSQEKEKIIYKVTLKEKKFHKLFNFTKTY